MDAKVVILKRIWFKEISSLLTDLSIGKGEPLFVEEYREKKLVFVIAGVAVDEKCLYNER